MTSSSTERSCSIGHQRAPPRRRQRITGELDLDAGPERRPHRDVGLRRPGVAAAWWTPPLRSSGRRAGVLGGRTRSSRVSRSAAGPAPGRGGWPARRSRRPRRDPANQRAWPRRRGDDGFDLAGPPGRRQPHVDLRLRVAAQRDTGPRRTGRSHRAGWPAASLRRFDQRRPQPSPSRARGPSKRTRTMRSSGTSP